MPLYEYHCGQCDLTFESLIRSASDQPSCPECRSIDVDKQLSVPASAQTAGGRAGMLPLSGKQRSCTVLRLRPAAVRLRQMRWPRLIRSRATASPTQCPARRNDPDRFLESHFEAGPLISQTSETWQPRPLAPRPFSICQLRSRAPDRVSSPGSSNSSGFMSRDFSKYG